MKTSITFLWGLMIGFSLGWALSAAAAPVWDGEVAAEHEPGVVTDVARVEAAILKLKAKSTPVPVHQLAALLVELSPDPILSVAILKQENSFRDVHVIEAGLDVETRQYRRVYKDLGIAQINAGTALEFNCDVEKLLAHDLREAITCHSRVLKAKLALCTDLGKESYSCYNSTLDRPRRAYVKAVTQWLNQIRKETHK